MRSWEEKMAHMRQLREIVRNTRLKLELGKYKTVSGLMVEITNIQGEKAYGTEYGLKLRRRNGVSEIFNADNEWFLNGTVFGYPNSFSDIIGRWQD